MKKYKQIKSEHLQYFINQLIKNKFAEDTIRMYKNYVSVFLIWTEEENLNPEQAKYTDIINFIEYLKEQEKSSEHM